MAHCVLTIVKCENGKSITVDRFEICFENANGSVEFFTLDIWQSYIHLKLVVYSDHTNFASFCGTEKSHNRSYGRHDKKFWYDKFRLSHMHPMVVDSKSMNGYSIWLTVLRMWWLSLIQRATAIFHVFIRIFIWKYAIDVMRKAFFSYNRELKCTEVFTPTDMFSLCRKLKIF